jgi:hypothetical protein
MHLIDGVDQGRNGTIHDLIGVPQAKLLGNRSPPVTGKHVRVRFVKNMSVRRTRAHAL